MNTGWKACATCNGDNIASDGGATSLIINSTNLFKGGANRKTNGSLGSGDAAAKIAI
ncbi:MAG: hypothetical protein M1438_06320 [Deltaproteobacteria bacterium]|nr:hypothetical protein [Deltaproteobacteria bacterium]